MLQRLKRNPERSQAFERKLAQLLVQKAMEPCLTWVGFARGKPVAVGS